MKVLVTGGGGFLGGWICRQLLQRGDEAVAFQRSPAPELEAAGATVLRGDIRDAPALERAMHGCEAVIHTAGKAGVWGDEALYASINVDGTVSVLEACRRHGVRRLVHTSSPSVVHGGGDIEGGDESLPYPERFSSPYPRTKARAERLVMAADSESLHTVCLRPHLIWGPGDNQLLPRLVERAKAGALRLPGPDKLIDTLYVENAAHAHLLALEALEHTPACRGKTYFISNGEPRPQREIIAGLLRAAGIDPEIREISPRLAGFAGAVYETAWKLLRRDTEPPVTRWSAEQLSTAHWYDISAARRDLGYEPKVSITEGLERMERAMGSGAESSKPP